MINWKELKNQIKPFLNKNSSPRSYRINSPNALKSQQFFENNKIIFSWIESLDELNCVIQNQIKEEPKCYICNEKAPYEYRAHKYKDHCIKCKYIDRSNRQKSGIINPIWNKGLTKETSDTVKRIGEAVSLRKKGQPLTENEYAHITGLLAELARTTPHTEERKAKSRATCQKNHGVNSYLEIVQPLGVKAIFEKYGMAFPATQQYKDLHDLIQEKTIKTNNEKYGTDSPMQNEDVKTKVFKKKKANKTFKTSKVEKRAIKMLMIKRLEVFTQYKNKKEYSFNCDIYLPKDNLYIELNYHWTHGNEPFNENNKNHIEIKDKWITKNKTSVTDYFLNAVNTWTVRDVNKKKYADKLNFKIFYNEDDFNNFFESLDTEEFIANDRKYSDFKYSEDKLQKGFKYLLSDYKAYNTNSKYTYLVQPFVNHLFYKKEYELLKDDNFELDLIQNRCLELNKTQDQLTDLEILRGITISGKYKGYSSFSPLIVKSFIRDYGVSSIYDPFGGWGQRMLGAWDIDYHFNDANKNLIKPIKDMYKYYNEIIPSSIKTFSYEDAAEYIPSKKYDAVLTCPPYYNTEIYNHDQDSYKLVNNYKEWLDLWWRKVIQNAKQTAPIFAYVISDKYAEDMNKILIEEGFYLANTHQVSSKKSSHLNTAANEKLYVFNYNIIGA